MVNERVKLRTHYLVECVGSDGIVKWVEDFWNLVVTAGLNKLLDATFKTGLTTPLWYVHLVDNAGFSAYAPGDTVAVHSGWVEGTPYSNANAPAFTPGAISGGSVDNSASKAVFNINAPLTVRGCALMDTNAKPGASGILYGEGDFSSARAVISGDTLNVQVTLTAA